MKLLLALFLCCVLVLARHDHHYFTHHHHYQHHYYLNEPPTDLSIWISEQQVKMFSGYSIRIFAIENGRVNPLLRDPAFDTLMPIIPDEIRYMNFTWTAAKKKYRYHFDQMMSLDENVLLPPVISIKPKGKIPQEPKRKMFIWQQCGSLNNLILSLYLFRSQNSV
jgi:WIF domain